MSPCPARVSQRVPKFAARNGIDACCGFVHEQNFRFRNERAHERQFFASYRRLIGPPAVWRTGPCQTFSDSERRACLFPREEHAAIHRYSGCFPRTLRSGVEAERLCKVSGPRPRVSRRLSKNFRFAARGFHHPSEDLKCGGLCPRHRRQIRPKISPRCTSKGNSAHGFEIAVAFREGSNTNGSIRRNAEVREEIFPLWSGRVHCAAR